MVLLNRAGAIVRKIIDSAREGEFDYNPRPPVKTNWTAYDLAQSREFVDTLELIRRFVDHAVGRIDARPRRQRRRPGRPAVPAAELAKILLLQSYLKVPNRVAVGLVPLFGEKLGIRTEFSYKSIERAYDRPAVREILDEVVALTNLPVRGLEKAFAVDGTGMTTTVKEHYASRREGQRRSREGKEAGDAFPRGVRGVHDFQYCVGMIGVRYKLYAAWVSSDNHRRGEVSFFPEVLRKTKSLHPDMEWVLGDGAYAGRPQVQLVSEVGAVPRFLPRRNVTMKRFGVQAWGDMLLAMAENPQGWFADYHLRSIAETGNYMVQNRHGKIRKRLPKRRDTESSLRALEHNIRQLVMLRYLVGVVPLPPNPTTAS